MPSVVVIAVSQNTSEKEMLYTNKEVMEKCILIVSTSTRILKMPQDAVFDKLDKLQSSSLNAVGKCG